MAGQQVLSLSDESNLEVAFPAHIRDPCTHTIIWHSTLSSMLPRSPVSLNSYSLPSLNRLKLEGTDQHHTLKIQSKGCLSGSLISPVTRGEDKGGQLSEG